MDNHKRSIAKSLTWRTFCFMLTVTIIFVYTKDIKQALGVGAGIDLTKLFLYYAHERIWNKVRFGRHKAGDYQI